MEVIEKINAYYRANYNTDDFYSRFKLLSTLFNKNGNVIKHDLSKIKELRYYIWYYKINNPKAKLTLREITILAREMNIKRINKEQI